MKWSRYITFDPSWIASNFMNMLMSGVVTASWLWGENYPAYVRPGLFCLCWIALSLSDLVQSARKRAANAKDPS